MNVHTKGKEPLYYQLYLSMVKDIQQGVYKENEKLPSKRAFSDYLGVSQNTIDAAYQMLVTEGYIRALPRSGFYVNPLPFQFLKPVIFRTNICFIFLPTL